MSATLAGEVLGGRDLRVAYGHLEVLRGVDLSVAAGELVALLGPNGAGKTTLLRTLAGYLEPAGGTVCFLGQECARSPHWRARNGVSYTGEDRHVFPGLTVQQSLRLVDGAREAAVEIFPELEKLRGRRSSLLSGGEQQMLALGRALAARPKVILVDELSLGLAPLVRARLLQALRAQADAGVAVMVVEQSVRDVLRCADRAYVLCRGEIVDERPAHLWSGDLAALGQLYLS